VTKSNYLTVRCLAGCETWLHPAAVRPHIELGRCRGHPWVEDIADAVLVAAPTAEILKPLLPPDLVARPTFSYDRLVRPAPGEYLRIDVCQGITVRSPINGVPSRRWLHVAKAAAGRDGEVGVRRAMTSDGFADLEGELVDSNEFLECPDCGEFVRRKGLATHRSRNVACRWQHAAAEVREAWQLGWRDPYSVPDAPLKWSDLRARSVWRGRLRTVKFPRWTAVLLAPASEGQW